MLDECVNEYERTFPIEEEYKFKKRMYRIRIEKLETRIRFLEGQLTTMLAQIDYSNDILMEKNELIRTQHGLVDHLREILVNAVEELKNESRIIDLS